MIKKLLQLDKCHRWYGTYHLWGKWVVIEKGYILDKITDRKVGWAMLQRQECERCGLKRFEKEEKLLNVSD